MLQGRDFFRGATLFTKVNFSHFYWLCHPKDRHQLPYDYGGSRANTSALAISVCPTPISRDTRHWFSKLLMILLLYTI